MWVAAAMLLTCGLAAFAQTPAAAPAAQATPAPAPAPPAPAAAPAATAPAMDAPLDIKAAAPPSTDELAKGDPGGTKTGTVSDVIAADTKKGLTLADVVNQAGQNRIAINFVWTLIAGFLVMFMQAGFAVVETGLTRAKNANHTMMMNFMVYGFGLFAFWVCGSRSRWRRRAVCDAGRHQRAQCRIQHQRIRKNPLGYGAHTASYDPWRRV